MKHLFIINPFAGGIKGRLEEVEREIMTTAKSFDGSYDIYRTKSPMDACNVIGFAAEPAEELYVYACGGDGTLNECVNGAALRPNVAVTHYPYGTGNDFLKTFGKESFQAFRDLKALAAGVVRPLDLIDCSGRYSINICSVGIDARVARDVHKYSSIPVIGGATGYVVALVVNVIRGVGERFRISTEENTQDRRITLACACNGQYYGGGFNPIPEAIPDDGLLEFLVVDAVSRFKVARIVSKYANGQYREFPDLITRSSGRYMEFNSDREFVINIDGETIHAKKIYFKLVPKGINFIFPAGFPLPGKSAGT